MLTSWINKIIIKIKCTGYNIYFYNKINTFYNNYIIIKCYIQAKISDFFHLQSNIQLKINYSL